MLVLSRKVGEKICIGDNICITVLDIDRGKVRLGIDVLRDVQVHRQEHYDAISGHRGADEEFEATARAAEQGVLSREVILFEEDGSTSLMTVS